MIARRFAAAGALALLMASAVPALSAAAPVDPARAILSAAEFPIGNDASYRVTHTVNRAPARASGLTTDGCELAGVRMMSAAAGSRSIEAMAFQGKTYASVEVTDRALVSPIRAVMDACRTTPNADVPVPIGTPAEFTRYRLIAGAASHGKELNGWAEVRGVTVQVVVDASPNPPDYDTFWRLFRAQIAKIERQQ